jgi:Protein of unknown function (DUF732)
VSQPRGTTRIPRTRWMRATPPALRAIVMVTALSVLVLVAASCGGSGRQEAIPDAQLLPSGPSPTIEAHIRARPWASSKAAGEAFGGIWREETHNPKDRDDRGIDAYKWAGRTCDAVRNGGQTPEAMVRRVHDEGRFTEQGAKVIVSAALAALCPERTGLTQPSP